VQNAEWRRVDDDPVEVPLVHRTPQNLEMGVVNGLKVPKNMPTPPLGASIRRMSDSRPMPKNSGP